MLHEKMKISAIRKCQLALVGGGRQPGSLVKCAVCPGRFICLSERAAASGVELPFWLFKVPNDEEGRHFIALAKKYLNRDAFGISNRGRAKDRKNKGGSQSSQPIATADWIAMYIKKSSLARMIWGHWNPVGRDMQ